MSRFYGQVEGMARTRASRQGSDNSHIRASVQSWNGSIITELYYDEADVLCIEVSSSEESSFRGRAVYNGPVERFVEMCCQEMRRLV